MYNVNALPRIRLLPPLPRRKPLKMEDCVHAQHGDLVYMIGSAIGVSHRYRVSGRCKTWKTRPGEFRLPIKYGLRESSAITQHNIHMFYINVGA